MPLFTPAEIAKLKSRFPHLDVDATARRCANTHAKRAFTNPPLMVLREWLEQEDRKRGRTTQYDNAPPERSDPTYAAFRMGLIKTILDKHLKPFEVADILADHFVKFKDLPGVACLLDQEIASLRGLGEDWHPAEKAPSLPADGWEPVVSQNPWF